jgi:hypothetical protein
MAIEKLNKVITAALVQLHWDLLQEGASIDGIEARVLNTDGIQRVVRLTASSTRIEVEVVSQGPVQDDAT